MVKIPKAIVEFMKNNNIKTVGIKDLDVFTTLKDITGKPYINYAVVLDGNAVKLKWTYIGDDHRFIVNTYNEIYEVGAYCALIEE